MARIKVSTVIAAPPEVVWEELRHIERHVDWMADAEAIRFTSRRREGKGTTFECDTRIGPFRLVDLMEVTEWRTGRTMGVRHTGLVTGEGGMYLKKLRGGRTRFTWDERFRFPWYFGGPVGGFVGGKPLISRVWKQNLANLKERVEG